MRVLLPLLLLLPALLFAQDYQTVRSDFIHFFLDENGNDHGLEIDSVEVNGNDSVFYNYSTLRFPDYAVIDAFVPSWVGGGVIIKSNGDNYFFNVDLDSILIKTQALLNESWPVLHLDGSAFIQGEVTAHQPESVLGITDSVKTISLQALDNLSNPINHPINGSTLKLSKSRGLTQGLDFHYFPNDTTEISLVGSENPSAGLHRFPRSLIYDYQIGDEFHYEGHESFWFGNPDQHKRIIRVIDIQNVGDSRTAQFEVYWWKQTAPGSVTTGFRLDTVDYDGLSQNLAEAMPGEAEQMFDTTNLWGSLDLVEYGHHQSGLHAVQLPDFIEALQWEPDTNGYWVPAQTISGYHHYESYFAVGLGRTYQRIYLWDGLNDYADIEESLVYFKKGIEEWGTPFTMSEIQTVDSQVKNDLLIFPNPIRSGQTLNLGQTWESIQVLNLSGQIILSAKQVGQLDTSELNPGIYFLNLEKNGDHLYQKLIVR